MAGPANGTQITGSLDGAAAKLLNFSEPLDVATLDATVNAFYGAASNEEV